MKRDIKVGETVRLSDKMKERLAWVGRFKEPFGEDLKVEEVRHTDEPDLDRVVVSFKEMGQIRKKEYFLADVEKIKY